MCFWNKPLSGILKIERLENQIIQKCLGAIKQKCLKRRIAKSVGLNSVRREILSLLQLFSMIKSEDEIKHRGDFFWSVEDFSFEKDTIGHIFTGQYYA
jgi:hypothetical protein